MSHTFIRTFNNRNRPILAGDKPVERTHFNLVRLTPGETYRYRLSEFESVVVPLTGTCDLTVNGESFLNLGHRTTIWDGKVDVGSQETKSRRRIFHILGQNGAGRAGNLLVSELYADEGCWSGYPPHKHDTDQPGETAHEEVYHWRFNPPNGFGAQLWYGEDGDTTAYMTRDGDTFAFSAGYHPTVTSPCHESYIFTILVGRTQRSLIQNFDTTYRHLIDRIPGIAAMREKFK
jgi:5-deoxy-glucuronate isomerase